MRVYVALTAIRFSHWIAYSLSLDLYNTKTHFLLEFIQNADDNEYETNVVPKLQLRLHGRQLVIRCNEKGFRAENVRAICDVRRSTKTKQPGSEKYIGEKGIGTYTCVI